MSLDWNATKVKPRADGTSPLRDEQGDLRQSAQTIIFSMMFVDMDEITAKNWQEAFERIALYELVNGSLRTKGGQDVFVTRDEVKELIGLRVNVIKKTQASFERSLGKSYIDRLKRSLAAAK